MISWISEPREIKRYNFKEDQVNIKWSDEGDLLLRAQTVTRSKLDSKKVWDVLSLVEFKDLAFRGALLIWSFDMGATFLTPWMSVETGFSPVMTLNGSDTLTGWKCSYAEEWRRLALHCSGRLLQRCLESMIEQVLSLLERGMLERNEQRHEWDEFCQWLCLFDPCLWSMEPRLDWLYRLSKCCTQNLPLHGSRWTRRGPHLFDPMAGVLWQPRNGPKKALKFIDLNDFSVFRFFWDPGLEDWSQFSYPISLFWVVKLLTYRVLILGFLRLSVGFLMDFWHNFHILRMFVMFARHGFHDRILAWSQGWELNIENHETFQKSNNRNYQIMK